MKGALTQQFGEFLSGSTHPFVLFQFLQSQGLLSDKGKKDFLQLLYSFDTLTPGIKEVTFFPRMYQTEISSAVHNLLINTQQFDSSMHVENGNNNYSIAITGTVESVKSLSHKLNEIPYFSSDFSQATRHYLQTLSERKNMSKNGFTARRAREVFEESHPFISLTLANNQASHMTIGFRPYSPIPSGGEISPIAPPTGK